MKPLPNYFLVIFLSVITLGIYSAYWSYQVAKRLYEISPVYGVEVKEKPHFMLLMNELGIDNVIVIGTGTNSSGKTENHAWNYVLLDNNWYAVDVTWDDPILFGDGVLPEKSKYKYFLKGSNTMNQNHVVSGKFTDGGQEFIYPTLNSKDYE